MAKRKRYIIVADKDTDRLAEMVNDLIGEGYKPQGGVSAHPRWFLQAMVWGGE